MQKSAVEPVRSNAPAFDSALSLHSVRDRLLPLAGRPPQVLLFEGGMERERFALARWWAALLNCEQKNAEGPCLTCSTCLQIGADIHLDILLVDGRISNKADEEAVERSEKGGAGAIRALTAERARELRRLVGEPPHGSGRRVIIMAGLETQIRDAAANTLLKVLEEPSNHTVFVLLAPQREQLLPTLVSRSWTLTLPWMPDELPSSALEWETALIRFLETGSGWFEKSSERGLDIASVQELLLVCRKALTDALAGRARDGVGRIFAARLDAGGMYNAAELFGHIQDALQYTVNPALAADILATALHSLISSPTHPSADYDNAFICQT